MVLGLLPERWPGVFPLHSAPGTFQLALDPDTISAVFMWSSQQVLYLLSFLKMLSLDLRTIHATSAVLS